MRPRVPQPTGRGANCRSFLPLYFCQPASICKQLDFARRFGGHYALNIAVGYVIVTGQPAAGPDKPPRAIDVGTHACLVMLAVDIDEIEFVVFELLQRLRASSAHHMQIGICPDSVEEFVVEAAPAGWFGYSFP